MLHFLPTPSIVSQPENCTRQMLGFFIVPADREACFPLQAMKIAFDFTVSRALPLLKLTVTN